MRKTATVQKVPFLAPDVVTKVIPSPTDGWDAISPLAEMDPKRAAILINWVPRPGYVELRGGYLSFSSLDPVTAAVETLMVYRSPTGEKLFAASDAHIFDVSTGIAASVVSGLGNARWQYVNFANAAGNYLLQCVNGVNQLQQFDGTTWTVPVITGLPGGTTANIVGIASAKQRLWYIMNNSSVAALMPAGANQGPIASTQDFALLWNKGGHLMAIANWTIDGGSGPQDYVAFVSSRGQISLYAGTDPTNANAWQLVGTFDIAPPIGRRCVTRVGSDVAVITQQGVIPISQALPFDPSADRSVAITARIQNAMSQASQLYKGNFGWEFTTFPDQTLAFLNVPQVENEIQVQYVMNTLTGAWCQFNGWNSNCFAVFNDKLYWGDNVGNVNQGWTSSGDLFNSISADMQCAFNWLDEPGKTKRVTMIQPLLLFGGTGLVPTLAIDTDFTTSTAAVPITSLFGGAMWDFGVWDTSTWSITSTNYTSFLSVDGLGHALAVRLRVTVASNNIPSPSMPHGPEGPGGPIYFGNPVTSLTTFGFRPVGTAIIQPVFNNALPVLQVNAFNMIAEMGGAI